LGPVGVDIRAQLSVKITMLSLMREATAESSANLFYIRFDDGGVHYSKRVRFCFELGVRLRIRRREVILLFSSCK